MTLLILGLILWSLAHYFKRLMPTRRETMGEKGKGPVALVIVVSLLLMIFGYRWAAIVPVWSPPAFLTHVNNLLMLGLVWWFVCLGSRVGHLDQSRARVGSARTGRC